MLSKCLTVKQPPEIGTLVTPMVLVIEKVINK